MGKYGDFLTTIWEWTRRNHIWHIKQERQSCHIWFTAEDAVLQRKFFFWLPVQSGVCRKSKYLYWSGKRRNQCFFKRRKDAERFHRLLSVCAERKRSADHASGCYCRLPLSSAKAFSIYKCIRQKTEEELYQAVEEFSYVHYNHVRPHSSNGYRTPYQARIAG